ncbi:MAG TPA: sugar transporter [Pseudolabrys sp.]|nr:sugar transporter [Pseudolabrys sp.]
MLAIIDKFQLFPNQRNLMSVTQLVDLMKKKAKIASLAQPLAFSRRSENPTIVFTVGFEDSDPAIAARVANELVTRILNEDLRDRTSRATDTTKFLNREMQRLQAENAAIDVKIAEAKQAQMKPASANGADQLAQMRAEYSQKSAVYSEKHPLMKTLKRQMDAVEKLAAPSVGSDGVGLEALQSQQETIQKNIEIASAKFAAAQLGEALEKNQQSEKLEVIEQPTVPQEPIKPDRRKIIGMSLLLALAAGGGLIFLLEMLDSTIRRSDDIYSLIDSQLVVSVPYIATKDEQLRSKRRLRILIFVAVPALLVFLGLVFFLMPPLDLMIAKARVGLFR